MQRDDAPGASEQAAVHADAHHARCLRAFGPQRIEAVAQVDEEVLAGGEALRQREAHVVAIERVGHDQVRHGGAVAALDACPERQVVAVVVAVVLEAADVAQQPPRVGAVAPGVPAGRRLAGERSDRLDAGQHVSVLRGFVDLLVVDPAPAVARDLVARFDERARDLGVALQGHAHAEYRQRQAAALELAQDAPHAHARAVFVDRLHAQVAVRVGRRARHLGEELLAAGVAMQHAVLAALLVVEDELQGHAGAPWPLRLRRMRAVADEVARVGCR